MKDLAAFRELSALLPGQVKADEPMALHTTWRIGGPADIFIEPAGLEELARAVTWVHRRGLPVYFIGNGSNLLVRDGGIRGVVVKIGRGLSWHRVDGTTIVAGAGMGLGALAALAQASGISGFEFSPGIPGTVGGAVVMNAGANGSCMADLVQEVLVMNRAGELERLPASGLQFGYRTSSLLGKSLVVVEVTCRGVKRDPASIAREMKGYLERRRATQPLSYPSAGSVFKNPPRYAAGWLIERAGCKGLREGDAQVSPVHANFIVNLGRATARDVENLIRQVQQRVYQQFGILLNLEVQILGEEEAG